MFEGKKVLVAGGSGLIGKQLLKLLLKENAEVYVADKRNFDKSFSEKVTFNEVDLTHYDNCISVCSDMDYVFNLLCIKGSPKAVKEMPVNYFDAMLLFNTNLLRAAHKCKVKKYLYTSSVGVYNPSEILYEDDVWKTFPSENDRFAGWVKRMGELQTQAYKIQYGWNDISIVRPTNTYGPYDDFDSDKATVVASLIKKICSSEDSVSIWGDGSSIRDFMYSEDVARGMMLVMEKSPGPNTPVNLGSGIGCSIRELVNVIMKVLKKDIEIVWDTEMPAGDNIRVLDISRAKSLGFEQTISLEEGITKTVDWYLNDSKN